MLTALDTGILDATWTVLVNSFEELRSDIGTADGPCTHFITLICLPFPGMLTSACGYDIRLIRW